MKKILLLLAGLLIGAVSYAQNVQDVIYLKNGSVIRGTLIEQVPDIKIHTADGSIWIFEADKVEKITQEPYQGKNSSQTLDVVPSYLGSQNSSPSGRRNMEYQPLHNGMRMMLGFSFQQRLDEYSCSVMDVDLSIGWQLAPRMYLGFGLADQIYIDYWFYGYKSYYAEPVAQIPFFLDFRYDHKVEKLSPYADFRFGYSFTNDELVDYSGMYLNPSVGIRYNRFSLSLGVEAVKLQEPWVITEVRDNGMVETTVNWQSSVQLRILYEWGGRR